MSSESTSLEVELSIAEEPGAGDEELPETSMMHRCLQAAWLEAVPAVVSLRISGKEEIRQLNRSYRDRDKATNVLSFPLQTPAEIEPRLLGDIVLCAAVIREEAESQGKSREAHWAHMLVHGMLHLQGYDHIDNSEAQRMESLETRILQQLGYPAPYRETP